MLFSEVVNKMLRLQTTLSEVLFSEVIFYESDQPSMIKS